MQLQHGLAARHSCRVLLHAGMSSPDFGSTYVPGHCPQPDPQDMAAPSVPAQSGMGPLVPPRLYPRSCCPPPWPEPLAAAAEADGPDVVAARHAAREELGDQLMNRLVYDSLQPAASRSQDCTKSSCQTTSPSTTIDASHHQLDPDGSSSQAAGGSGGTAQQQGDYAYAPGLAPWYMPEDGDDATLVFESRFESGNLRRAIQVGSRVHAMPLVCGASPAASASPMKGCVLAGQACCC